MLDATVPPHDLDLECAILASAIIDPPRFVEGLSEVKAEWFYSGAHQRIFEACESLTREGAPCDVVNVGTWLKRNERLAEVGGLSYLMELINLGTLPDLPSATFQLRERWTRRELIRIGQRGIADGYHSPHITTAALIERIGDELHTLMKARTGNRMRLISYYVTKFTESVKRAHLQQSSAGLITGIDSLDELMGGLFPGDVTLVAARPAMGKSAFAFQMGATTGRRPIEQGGGAPVVFSLEMQGEQIAGRLVSSGSGIPLAFARQGMRYAPDQIERQTSDWQEFTAAALEIAKQPMWLDDTPAISINTMRARLQMVRRLTEQKGVPMRVVIIDYAQLMRGTPSRSGNREGEIAEVSREVKAIAKEFEVPIVLLSQLNREVEKRANKRPMLSDLRESGALEQDADNVLFLYRDDYYDANSRGKGVVELILAKCRNGQTGTALAGWNGGRTLFFNLPLNVAEAYTETLGQGAA